MTVQRVVDGDVFYAEELNWSIRLWGIDAPGRGDLPAGPDATSFLRPVVEQPDRRLFCVPNDLDRYGRQVARCYTPDGQDLQWGMISAGHAIEWCRYSKKAYEECGKLGGRAKRCGI